jgi:hypothetical protein
MRILSHVSRRFYEMRNFGELQMPRIDERCFAPDVLRRVQIGWH